MTDAPKDCSHPARKASHEVYARQDASTFCRACGAELSPPSPLYLIGYKRGLERAAEIAEDARTRNTVYEKSRRDAAAAIRAAMEEDNG